MSFGHFLCWPVQSFELYTTLEVVLPKPYCQGNQSQTNLWWGVGKRRVATYFFFFLNALDHPRVLKLPTGRSFSVWPVAISTKCVTSAALIIQNLATSSPEVPQPNSLGGHFKHVTSSSDPHWIDICIMYHALLSLHLPFSFVLALAGSCTFSGERGRGWGGGGGVYYPSFSKFLCVTECFTDMSGQAFQRLDSFYLVYIIDNSIVPYYTSDWRGDCEFRIF